MLRRLFAAVRRTVARADRRAGELGQTTAEYALVILGAAALATLLITWASKSHAITKLFDTVIGKFKFNEKGDPNLPPYAVYRWSNGTYEEIGEEDAKPAG